VILEEDDLPAAPALSHLSEASEPDFDHLDTVPPAVLRAGRQSGLRGWASLVWGALGALVVLLATAAAWDAFVALLDRNIWLGRTALGLAGIVALGLVFAVLKELWALRRLSSVAKIRAAADRARAGATLGDARAVAAEVVRATHSLDATRWGRAALAGEQADILDADALLDATERHLMTPLDDAALREVQSAARRIATATAIIPMPAGDVLISLYTAVTMIRRVAESYGARSGALGAWRLFRMVIAQLIASGAVAVGDDLVGSVVGGGVVSKLSRRFGEGVVNGALMARVGIAAMEVCRPMPFSAKARPTVSGIVKGALAGLFSGRGETPPVQ
jgi:putative membrane protein